MRRSRPERGIPWNGPRVLFGNLLRHAGGGPLDSCLDCCPLAPSPVARKLTPKGPVFFRPQHPARNFRTLALRTRKQKQRLSRLRIGNLPKPQAEHLTWIISCLILTTTPPCLSFSLERRKLSLRAESANFCCKKPDNKDFQLQGSQTVTVTNTTLPSKAARDKSQS